MMQLVVFAAFAMVLGIPPNGVPDAWIVVGSASGTWAAVIGQVVLAGVVGAVFTRLVKQKLEREAAWLQSGQRRLAQGNMAVRLVSAVGFGLTVYATDWANIVQGWGWVRPIWGLDEIIILLPFLGSVMVSWIALYPADRAIRQVALELRLWGSFPARPVWKLGAYLGFMLRQHVLIVAAPMIPIVVAYDFSRMYAKEIRSVAFDITWANEALVAIVAGLVFLIAPVMLCYIWHTRALPSGELRRQLDALCKRVGMRYRRILVWETDGMLVNAAVMGLVARVRYILLSDGLLEMMRDNEIEAVFGHEVGHIKHRHIQFYLLFAIASMLIVGGITELAVFVLNRNEEWVAGIPNVQDYLHVGAMALMVLIWALGFGAVSRRFEWQADLFGARSVTPPPEACNRPCHLHGTATEPGDDSSRRQSPVCATAANLFADALHRIAVLNGIPIQARSWRHSSIGNRMELLKQYGDDPTAAGELERSVITIKTILLIGTFVGMIIAVRLYWPTGS